MQDEAQFKKHVKEQAVRYGSYCASLVAGTMMAGQPDALFYNRRGAIIAIESKIWRNKSLPTAEGVTNLLKGAQVGVIKHQLWPRKACVVIAARLDGMSKLDECAVVWREHIHFCKVDSLVRLIANVDTSNSLLNYLFDYLPDPIATSVNPIQPRI